MNVPSFPTAVVANNFNIFLLFNWYFIFIFFLTSINLAWYWYGSSMYDVWSEKLLLSKLFFNLNSQNVLALKIKFYSNICFFDEDDVPAASFMYKTWFFILGSNNRLRTFFWLLRMYSLLTFWMIRKKSKNFDCLPFVRIRLRKSSVISECFSRQIFLLLRKISQNNSTCPILEPMWTRSTTRYSLMILKHLKNKKVLWDAFKKHLNWIQLVRRVLKNEVNQEFETNCK